MYRRTIRNALNKISPRAWRIFHSTVAFLIFIAGALTLLFTLHHLFGKTTVTTDFEGQSVRSKVLVNDKYMGDTPFHGHVGVVGNYKISVVPPAEFQEVPGQHFGLIFGGVTVRYTLTKKVPYRVLLTRTMGDAEFEVAVGTEPVGVCSGKSCTIPLAGPGEYRARMSSCSEDGKCITGDAYFTLSDAHREHEITWKD